jgi:hypothetical protein
MLTFLLHGYEVHRLVIQVEFIDYRHQILIIHVNGDLVHRSIQRLLLLVQEHAAILAKLVFVVIFNARLQGILIDVHLDLDNQTNGLSQILGSLASFDCQQKLPLQGVAGQATR